jgi:hypothetical protein
LEILFTFELKIDASRKRWREEDVEKKENKIKKMFRNIIAKRNETHFVKKKDEEIRKCHVTHDVNWSVSK